MATLPRGILKAQHTNKDGSTTTMYRVRIVRKDFKTDKRFNDLEEAKEFLALSKAKKGKEIIYKITEEERLKNKPINQNFNDYTLGHFIELFINDYVLTRPKTTELEKRNINNILSFYKTISNTSIIDKSLSYQEKEEMGIDGEMPVSKFMYSFDIRKLTKNHINLYIKERLQNVKASSVSRELSHLSNIFTKLEYLSNDLDDLANPIRSYDKSLLKNRNSKKEFSITTEEEKRFFQLLSEKNNKQLFGIAKISVLTSLRRSEIIYLTHSQIKDNYIQLIHTKSGNPRKVYIDKVAKEYLNSFQKLPNTDRLFTLTVAGFDRLFRTFTDKHGFKISFHDLRRLAISRKIVEIGAENSVFISEFLGIQSVPKLEFYHIDSQANAPINQSGALKSFGHSFAQTTKIYFNMPKSK